MDIFTLNRAKKLQEELQELIIQRDTWQDARCFCSGIEIWDGTYRCEIKTSLIDFEELRSRTLAYINSKIEALEKEFKEL